MTKTLGLAALALLTASPAVAGELYGGVLAQGTVRPFSNDIGDRGTALQLGWRSERIAGLGPIGGPRAYAFGSVNTDGGTNFLAGGLSWRLGGLVYVRPGIGLAGHDGKSRRYDENGDRIDLGSRVLFEPELAVGTAIGPVSVEVAYVHLSHAQIFSKQNPGLDMIGLRVNVRLP